MISVPSYSISLFLSTPPPCRLFFLELVTLFTGQYFYVLRTVNVFREKDAASRQLRKQCTQVLLIHSQGVKRHNVNPKLEVAGNGKATIKIILVV